MCRLIAILTLGAMLAVPVSPALAAGPELHSPDIELVPGSNPAPATPAVTRAPLRQAWVISSRRAGRCDPQDAHLEYWRHDDCAERWIAAGQAEFLATDRPGVITCFYVHGNRISHGEALRDGRRAYRQVARCLPDGQPLRFVVWSWPSTQIEGPLKDVRQKACISDWHAWHLAWLVDQIHPEVPISLVGYSYGARMIGGSLHLLGGGRLAGHVLTKRLHPARLPLRAVLLAGALDSHSLLPHGRNHRAMSQVEKMLVTVNSRDSVLHHYPLLTGLFHKGPPALGYTGFYTGSLGHERGKVAQWNVSSYVGSEHDWQRYFYSPAILARLRSYALSVDQQSVAGQGTKAH